MRAGRAASLLFILHLPCCSSSDANADSSSAYHSRVDESKTLGALTPTEQTTLCQDVASWTQALTKDPAYVAGLCTLSAISTSSLNASTNHLTVDQMREACRTAEAQCISQQSSMPLPSSRGCAYPTSCTATVADLRDCTVGTYQGNLDLYATLPSCDQVQLDTVSKIDSSLATKAASVCSKVTACGLPQ